MAEVDCWHVELASVFAQVASRFGRAGYWRTNLTMRQLAPPFGVSKSAADRIIDHLAPTLAMQALIAD